MCIGVCVREIIGVCKCVRKCEFVLVCERGNDECVWCVCMCGVCGVWCVVCGVCGVCVCGVCGVCVCVCFLGK